MGRAARSFPPGSPASRVRGERSLGWRTQVPPGSLPKKKLRESILPFLGKNSKRERALVPLEQVCFRGVSSRGPRAFGVAADRDRVASRATAQRKQRRAARRPLFFPRRPAARVRTDAELRLCCVARVPRPRKGLRPPPSRGRVARAPGFGCRVGEGFAPFAPPALCARLVPSYSGPAAAFCGQRFKRENF